MSSAAVHVSTCAIPSQRWYAEGQVAFEDSVAATCAPWLYERVLCAGGETRRKESHRAETGADLVRLAGKIVTG